MKKYNVYKITNKVNGKFYIGVHKGCMDDYWGSGIAIKRAVEKYGYDNFDKEILHTYNNKDTAYLKESELVDKDNELSYNLNDGGFGGWEYVNNECINGFKDKHHTAETKQFLSDKFKGMSRSPDTEWKKGKLPHNTGKEWSQETKDKISKSLTGRKRSKESNEKNSQFNLQWNDNPFRKPWKELVGGKYDDLCEQRSNRMKEDNPMTQKKGTFFLINNGTSTKHHPKHTEIPEGWVKGRHWSARGASNY